MQKLLWTLKSARGKFEWKEALKKKQTFLLYQNFPCPRPCLTIRIRIVTGDMSERQSLTNWWRSFLFVWGTLFCYAQLHMLGSILLGLLGVVAVPSDWSSQGRGFYLGLATFLSERFGHNGGDDQNCSTMYGGTAEFRGNPNFDATFSSPGFPVLWFWISHSRQLMVFQNGATIYRNHHRNHRKYNTFGAYIWLFQQN